tara:strand:- start:85703 stop:87166 length:1464 start_codon:yes stop_codon:yes gene_type:complete
MSLKLYNTLSGEKETFKTLEPNKVKMYVCGPTVYDFLHIGNFRGPIFFNLVRNWLEHSGYDVTYAYNYTDVDDKIIKRANDEGVESIEISERFIKEFEQDFATLGLKKHDHNPKVTEHIPEIINIVETLVAKDRAYVIDGEVFYSIDSFKTYGKLSKKKLDELDAHRVDVDKRKKNPGDFVLWKPSKPGEPSWDSPWGKGRPGWHIECSAMNRSLFGDSIDIHGGGIDLIFPHHENEIAQSEGCCDKSFSTYWMHNNFINMNNEKMSKSLGNIMTARSFCENYHAEILKYLFLSVHYRSMLSVSDEKIVQVIAALNRIYSSIELAKATIDMVDGEGVVDKNFQITLDELDKKIKASLDDDFNTAEFVSYVFEGVRAFNALGFGNKQKRNVNHKGCSNQFYAWIMKYGKISALFNEDPTTMLNQLDEIALKVNKIDKASVEQLIEKRKEARDAKDWEAADKIRDELNALGVELTDGSGRGYRVKLSLD